MVLVAIVKRDVDKCQFEYTVKTRTSLRNSEVLELLSYGTWLHRVWCACYNSFFFLHRSSFALLPSLHTILLNTLHLNTASFLHTVHGSLTPFPPTFYGRPSFTRVTSTRLLPIYRTAQAFPLYPPRFLCYEHCLVCVLHSHLFKRRYCMYSL